MDFDLPSDDDPRRLEVRAWCDANPCPTGEQLLEAGYTVPHWPPPWGVNADPELQLIISDELARAKISHGRAQNFISNIAGVVRSYATPEQVQAIIRPGLTGEASWCQLYSEPTNGSDLAGLRTRARRDGDVYIVNGAKCWNGGARSATRGLLIARTDIDAPKHKGLSAFLIDMTAPGVEVRPIRTMTGSATFDEVFLTDVEIPVDALLGQEGDGWAVVTNQLQFERTALAGPGAILGRGPTAKDLLNLYAELGMLDDPAVRQKAAELYIEGSAIQLLAYRTLTRKMNRALPGPEAAMGRFFSGLHGKRVLEEALEALGTEALDAGAPIPKWFKTGDNGAESEGAEDQDASDEATDDVEGGLEPARAVLWRAPSVTIMIGTTEVMKNVIGERILGLPRDRDPDAKLPWSQRGSERMPA